jgi:hypothetical protein
MGLRPILRRTDAGFACESPKILSFCLALALLAGPGSPYSSASPEKAVSELAGKTVILGGRSTTFTDVSLRAPATVDTSFSGSRSLKIHSPKDLVAFVLLPLGKTSGPGILGGRISRADYTTDFISPIDRWNYDFAKYYEDEFRLEPGEYRLYVVPGSAPARIELKLKGLEGSTMVKPDRSAQGEFRRPDPRALGAWGALPFMNSFGSTGRLGTHGLLFQALWLQTDVHLGGQYQFCLYRNRPGFEVSELEDAGYGPGCPGAIDQSGGRANDRYYKLAPDTKFLFESHTRKRGEYSMGMWYATESDVKDLQYYSLWLSTPS